MLNENHLEQNHRVNTWSAVVGTIPVLYEIVDFLKSTALSILRSKWSCDTKFSMHMISTWFLFCTFFSNISITKSIIPYLKQKGFLKAFLFYFFVLKSICSAHFIPSTAADIIPPAYPAPSPQG